MQGEPTLVTDAGEVVAQARHVRGLSGRPRAHQLVNRTDRDVLYLEVGDRTPGDEGFYPADDIQASQAPDGKWIYTPQGRHALLSVVEVGLRHGVAEGEDLALGRVAIARRDGGRHRPEERDQGPLDLAIGRGRRSFSVVCAWPTPDWPASRSTRAVSGAASLSNGAVLAAVMRKVSAAAPMPSPQRCSTLQTVRQVSRNFGKIARLIGVGLRSRV